MRGWSDRPTSTGPTATRSASPAHGGSNQPASTHVGFCPLARTPIQARPLAAATPLPAANCLSRNSEGAVCDQIMAIGCPSRPRGSCSWPGKRANISAAGESLDRRRSEDTTTSEPLLASCTCRRKRAGCCMLSAMLSLRLMLGGRTCGQGLHLQNSSASDSRARHPSDRTPSAEPDRVANSPSRSARPPARHTRDAERQGHRRSPGVRWFGGTTTSTACMFVGSKCTKNCADSSGHGRAEIPNGFLPSCRAVAACSEGSCNATRHADVPAPAPHAPVANQSRAIMHGLRVPLGFRGRWGFERNVAHVLTFRTAAAAPG
jgi:hypothetical protein